MPIATRLTNTGTLLVNGSFDEQTDNLVYNSNLTLYLNASKTSSYPGTGTAWSDLSGNGNNATLVASPTYSSGAIVFNSAGTGQYATVPITAIPSGGSQVSVCCWVNLGNPATPPSASVFTCSNSVGNRIINIHLPWSDSIVYWDCGNSGGTYNRINTSTLTLAQKTGWHHWAFTKNATAGTMAIYLDGVSIATGTGKTLTLDTVSTASSPCAIANFQGSANWNGSVSSFQIYNVELTAAQVAQNYSATSAPYTKFKTTSTAVYATELDEVTYNLTSPTIKNLLPYSQDFTQWSKNASPNDYTVTSNSIIAPDNTLTADLIIKGTGAGSSSIVYKSFSGTTSTVYCGSIYLKAGGYSKVTVKFDNTAFASTPTGGQFDLATGTVNSILNGSTVTIADAGNGWYRISVTATSDSDGGNYIFAWQPLNSSYIANFAGDGTSGIYAWGAQVELGSVATIYQPTLDTNTLLDTGMRQRVDSSGNQYMAGIFDEFTGAPVVDSSLTMWLDFGQTASYSGSGATVNDLSPTCTANVTLTGSPTFSSTDGGGSETFNGTSQYGTGSGAPLGSSAYTKSFWFQLSSYGVNNNVVSGATGQHFSYFGGGTRLQNGHSFWGNFGAFSSVTTFSLNTWYHAVVTFNTATGMALYVNGALDSTYVSTSGTSRTDTALTGNGQVDIAQFGGGNLLSGKIGQVMIYNRALTADEVSTNFNALRGRYSI